MAAPKAPLVGGSAKKDVTLWSFVYVDGGFRMVGKLRTKE